MAFSGTLISCAYASFASSPPLLGKLVWAQHMLAPGECELGAPEQLTPGVDVLIFEVYADQDVLVSYGDDPDPVYGPRVLVKAAMTYDFVARAGDRIAWVTA